MTGVAHRTSAAAAAAGGLALFLVADEGVQKQAEEQDQTGDDEDGGEMDRHGNLLSGGNFGFIEEIQDTRRASSADTRYKI